MTEQGTGRQRPPERLIGEKGDRARAIRSWLVYSMGLRGKAVVDAQELRHPEVEHIKIGVASPHFDPAEPAFGMTHIGDFSLRGLTSEEMRLPHARVIQGTFVNEAGKPYVEPYGARVRVELANVPIHEGLLLRKHNGREVAVVGHIRRSERGGNTYQAQIGRDLYFRRHVSIGRTSGEFTRGVTGEMPAVRVTGEQDTIDFSRVGRPLGRGGRGRRRR